MHPAAVRVHNYGHGEGSGIAISQHCVLTVWHLFSGGVGNRVTVDPLARSAGGSRVAYLEAHDELNDLAVVRVTEPLDHWVELPPETRWRADYAVFYGWRSGVVTGRPHNARVNGVDCISISHRAQSGDSGAGMFVRNSQTGEWHLAGVLSTTDNRHSYGASTHAIRKIAARCNRGRQPPPPQPQPLPQPLPDEEPAKMSTRDIVLLLFGIAGFAIATIMLVWTVWRRIIDRRRRAAESADKLRAVGLVFLPATLDAYARGDYRDAAFKAEQAASALLNPDTILMEFGKVLDRLVANKSTRDTLKQKIELAEKAGG